MILSDGQIKKLMGAERLVIQSYNEKNLTPNGYDVTVEEVFVSGSMNQKEGLVKIPQGTWFAVSTKEYFRFPANVAGQIWIRTTWARKGVLASFGMIDAGFQGNLTLSAYNTHQDIEIPINDTFAQIAFHMLEQGAEKQYAERSGNYQGQKGVRL
ncbi:MAG: dCTP deaminase [Thermoplasmata archaeon]